MKLLSEIYIVILWSEALYQKNKILQDINNRFEIIEINIIEWSKNTFFENLFIFYNGELPIYSEKDKYSDNKLFYCVVIKDNNVKYATIITDLVNKHLVNLKLYKAKELYRNWTGGGHKIHSSDNIIETNYQVKLLFGKSYKDYLSILPTKSINYLNQGLIY